MTSNFKYFRRGGKLYIIYLDSKTVYNARSYRRIETYKDNGYTMLAFKKPKSLHRLLMEQFQPRLEQNKLQVHHIDFRKHNNDLSNLMWITQEEHSKLHLEHNRKQLNLV